MITVTEQMTTDFQLCRAASATDTKAIGKANSQVLAMSAHGGSKGGETYPSSYGTQAMILAVVPPTLVMASLCAAFSEVSLVVGGASHGRSAFVVVVGRRVGRSSIAIHISPFNGASLVVPFFIYRSPATLSASRYLRGLSAMFCLCRCDAPFDCPSTPLRASAQGPGACSFDFATRSGACLSSGRCGAAPRRVGSGKQKTGEARFLVGAREGDGKQRRTAAHRSP